jgi:flagellar basal body-associated protein FliL
MKVITIGRDSASNEIAISDPKASRTHLQLVMDDNGNIFAVDLNSTNGTFINGQRITGQAPLHPGDDLRIGDTSLPWLSYLQNATAHTPSATPIADQQNSSNSQGGGKKKALIWIIVASAVVLIALGIGLVLLFNNGNNVEPPETTTNDTDSVDDTPEPIPGPNWWDSITIDTTSNKYKPYLQNIYKDLREQLRQENGVWLQAVKDTLRVPNLKKLDSIFNKSNDNGKTNIINKIKKLKQKNTPDTNSKVIEARFETLLDDLEKNKDWKDTVFKLYNVKNKDGLRATFTAMNNPNDRKEMIITINSLRNYKKSNGGNGSGSGNNATNGNGASDKTATGGSSDSSVNTKTVNTFKDLVAKMTDKEVREFCRSTYKKYNISCGPFQTYRDLLLEKYDEAIDARKKNLEKDLREFLGNSLDS